MLLLRTVLLVLMLCVWQGVAVATGPSSADIRIEPLAVNQHGHVLFKTRSHLNRMGAYSMEGVEYGWLVVSGSGIWEEVLESRIDRKQSEDQRYLRHVEETFENRTGLHAAPEQLRQLMAKYGFHEEDSTYLGSKVVDIVWHPHKFCTGEHCVEEPLRQRSLHGLVSDAGRGSPVMSRFFCCGMVLLTNRYDYESNVVVGAEFGLASKDDKTFPGFDIWSIDAIAIRFQ